MPCAAHHTARSTPSAPCLYQLAVQLVQKALLWCTTHMYLQEASYTLLSCMHSLARSPPTLRRLFHVEVALWKNNSPLELGKPLHHHDQIYSAGKRTCPASKSPNIRLVKADARTGLQHSSTLLQLTLGSKQQRQHTLLHTAAADAQLTDFEHDPNSPQQQLQAPNSPS